jgi:hypothetical protein
MSYNLKTTNTELFLVPPLGIGRNLLKEHGLDFVAVLNQVQNFLRL